MIILIPSKGFFKEEERDDDDIIESACCPSTTVFDNATTRLGSEFMPSLFSILLNEGDVIKKLRTTVVDNMHPKRNDKIAIGIVAEDFFPFVCGNII